MPHQREPYTGQISTLEMHIQNVIIEIFDRGFQVMLDRRIQSAEQLASMIQQAQSAPSTSDEADPILEIKAFAKRESFQQFREVEKKISSILHEIQREIISLCIELGDGFSTGQGGWNISPQNLTGESRFAICPSGNTSMNFWALFRVTLTGSEFVVTALDEGSGAVSPVSRIPATGDTTLSPTTVTALRRVMTTGLRSKLSG